MKDVREIKAELDKVHDLVNEGDPRAEVIWDSLRWVLEVEDAQSPVEIHIGDEEEGAHTAKP